MLVRFDPFRELTRPAMPQSIPMNAVRRGDHLLVSFDLPGVPAEAVDLTVERNQLTVTAERAPRREAGDEWLVAERPVGRFTRQLLLGDTLDTERIEATFADGVLEVRIPVAETAKPRKVAINGLDRPEAIAANSHAAA